MPHLRPSRSRQLRSVGAIGAGQKATSFAEPTREQVSCADSPFEASGSTRLACFHSGESILTVAPPVAPNWSAAIIAAVLLRLMTTDYLPQLLPSRLTSVMARGTETQHHG